jgi:homocysteine S-methyltransferase
MATVSQKYAERAGRPLFLCDFSPPRGADLSTVERVKQVGADFVCVAYSPGKSVRADSVAMAHLIADGGDQDVIFNLAGRDMNRLAIQNHLLGAQLLGLANLVVLQGDRFTARDRESVKDVGDYQPTELIQAIGAMNEGLDFRGLHLRAPTIFCTGAVIDFSRGDVRQEVLLAQRKVIAGADYFIAQAFYEVEVAHRFLQAYRDETGQEFPKPVFYGLQILEKDGLVFGDVPEALRRDLERGRSGVEIALEQLHTFVGNGFDTVYVVPPILRGGRRDYKAAQDLLAAFRR